MQVNITAYAHAREEKKKGRPNHQAPTQSKSLRNRNGSEDLFPRR